MVTHFFERAADRIKRPLADVTAQSERIDEVFGPADSADRQRISSALGRIASRMRTATTAAEWQSLFG
jgi:2-oxo-4-hydroxy-4-carboxy--5-ureidoimidazoline (OHCU) decarboxylase